MGIFTSIPKSKQTLFGNGLVTELSPFGNGDPFLYGDPHIETGNHVSCSPYGNRDCPFPYGDVLFPYGDHHTETGIDTSPYGNRRLTEGRIKTTLPISIWGIPVQKWGGRPKNSHMGTPRFRTEFVPIWGLTYIPFYK